MLWLTRVYGIAGGKYLGVTGLGYYSAIALLIYYPSSAVASYMHAIALPMIATQRDCPSKQRQLSDVLGGQTLVLAVAMAAGFAVVAPPSVPVLFGERFAQPALLIGLVGILQSSRFFLNWPTTTSLALGRSTTVLTSNFVFPGAFIGLQMVGGLNGVTLGYIGAEFIAICVALCLLNRCLRDQSMTASFALQRSS